MKSRVSIVDIFDENNVGTLSTTDCNDNILNVDQLVDLAHEYLPFVKVCDSLDNNDVYSLELDKNPSPLKPENFLVWLDRYDKFEKSKLLHNLRYQGAII